MLTGFVCPSVYLPLSLCCVLCGSQQHDQGLTLLWWQLLAAVEKTDQFGFSLRRSPAMLPMTPQNIQLLGSTEGAGGHQKKRIVALQNENCSPMKELIFCPFRTVSSALAQCSAVMYTPTQRYPTFHRKLLPISLYNIHKFIEHRAYKTGGGLNNQSGLFSIYDLNVHKQHKLSLHFGGECGLI